MRLSLRAILLLVAIVLFLLALVLEENANDLLILGLVAFAGAFLADELGLDTRTRRPGV